MGYTSYSVDTRSMRASSLGYSSKSVDQIFTQQKTRQIHESMSPKGLTVRECRDSEAHPKSLPIILALDVTGSMGRIPHDLVKDGLPTIMSTLIEKGAKDASLCFVAVGDHECDRFPLQVSQFESGDAELDMWLTRTYIEGGGGGNAGESYNLAWHFAGNYTSTDSWEKRKEKGILITIGDEPVLSRIQNNALREIYGTESETVSNEVILQKALEQWDIYHIHINHRTYDKDTFNSWKKILGERVISIDNFKDVPSAVSKIVLSSRGDFSNNELENIPPEEKSNKEVDIIL